MEKFETETHSKDIEIIYDKPLAEIEDIVYDNSDTLYNFKVKFRLLRKKFSAFIRKKVKKDFKQILYITVDKPPFDYILAIQRQYPDKKIKVLIPITQTEGLHKTSVSFDFFLQNRMNNAVLYNFPRNRENIEVCGLYSESWQNGNMHRLQYLAPFIKAVRICAKKLKPDVIHSEYIPFFLGSEFEAKLPYPIKVFQTIKDFYLIELNKTETFWAAVNLVNKQGMKKICSDKIIKKCIAALFNLHNTKRFYQMRECLEFIYQNYFKFRRYIDKCEDIEENILFNRLNARILKLFPQMAYEDELLYNSMYYTLKKTDAWAVISKTYYEDLFNRPEISGKIFKRIHNTKHKSHYVSYGASPSNVVLYQPFTTDNFRELRASNKKYIIKELSQERIATKFIDNVLFRGEDYTIKGYLDSFYFSPLIFCFFKPEIYTQGIDIAFNSLIKLFELNKNIQVIINIPDGLNNSYIRNSIEFLEKNSSFNGRWVFIDGKINLQQFYAASDIALFTKRINIDTNEHYLSLKYGCIPVTGRNGIYNDTIADIFDDITYGCGFKTKTSLYTNEDVNEIYLHTLLKALNLYTQNPASWNLLIKNAMEYNSEWTFEIIEKYNKIYEMQ